MQTDESGGVRAQDGGAGKFQVEIGVRDVRLLADEPVDVGGGGAGPTPYELLAAGLAACTVMTTRLYADRKGWPLQRTRVVVRHEKLAGQTPADVFHRQIAFDGPLAPEQAAKLLEVAEKCPVHRTLESGARVETTPLAAAPPAAPTAVAADPDEHFQAMEKTCREAGAS